MRFSWKIFTRKTKAMKSDPKRDDTLREMSNENVKEMLKKNLNKMSVIHENKILSRSKSMSRSRGTKNPKPYNLKRTQKLKNKGEFASWIKKIKSNSKPVPKRKSRRHPNVTL